MADGFLSNFKSSINGNFARAYLFYVKFPDPGAVNLPQNQRFLVRSTSLPASTIEEIPIPYQGMVYKIGSTQVFETWECTFNADNAMSLRREFVRWMQAVHNPVNNEHGLPSNYFGKAEIEMLDPFQNFGGDGAANANYVATLYDAWPSSVGALDLAYDSKEVAQFSVTFTYNWHEENQT